MFIDVHSIGSIDVLIGNEHRYCQLENENFKLFDWILREYYREYY